jgi:rare lipoprotein A
MRVALCALLFAILSSCSSRQTVQQKPYPQELPSGQIEAVASWYGADFHGRPTASGELFNMHAYTCAHKEYPFGTQVRVTLAANHKAVQCTVNDRGPFTEGRDIDLSYAAAREIGLIGPGTARVQLEVTGREMSYIKPVKVQSTGARGPFAVQVGAFAESINAVRLKAALRLNYANAYTQETEINGTTFYRVRVGNFDQFSAAMETAEKLGQEGYPAFIVKADLQM